MKFRTALEGIGILALLITWFYAKRMERFGNDMLQKTGFLADHLDSQVTISENLLQELKRTKDGKVKIITRFLPPEGKTTIEIPKDGKPRVIVDNSGFTFRPGISFSYNDRLKLAGSTKVFFWGRYGAVVNLGTDGLYGGVSRYVDDLVPFWRPKNLEIYGAYRVLKFESESPTLSIGWRVSF